MLETWGEVIVQLKVKCKEVIFNTVQISHFWLGYVLVWSLGKWSIFELSVSLYRPASASGGAVVSDRCSLIIFTEETLLLGREKKPLFWKVCELTAVVKRVSCGIWNTFASGFSFFWLNLHPVMDWSARGLKFGVEQSWHLLTFCKVWGEFRISEKKPNEKLSRTWKQIWWLHQILP